MIEDLDGIVEPRPTWRDRWLLPALGGLALTAVFATAFVRVAAAPAVQAGQPIAAVRAVRVAVPAAGIRTLELPRTVGTLEVRAQLSGVTGLTSMDMSDGFRDLYRLADGRSLVVLEYPDRSGNPLAPAANALEVHRVTVRGLTGLGYTTTTASLSRAIAWSADAMQYVVGGAGFSEDELIRLAAQLR